MLQAGDRAGAGMICGECSRVWVVVMVDGDGRDGVGLARSSR